MHDHHLLGSCGAFLRSVASHWHDGGRLHNDAARAHELWQTSMLSALLEGVYEGEVTYEELARHGDFGLGTFNDLDGEMIAVDGRFFQLRSDGTAHRVDPAQKTPFAVMTFFRPEVERRIERTLPRTALFALLDELAPSHNLFYAIRVEGCFSSVLTRTVRRQEKPYRPLTEVTAEQATFQFNSVSGTIAGFRSPDYMQGISAAGYHLHFITSDRSGGGHVLDLEIEDATLTLDHTSGLHVEVPETAAFLAAGLNKPGHAEAIKKAEG
ncbi:MAG: acetolactate decarboxylase [Acidobacteria bacterium]|nr:acetolactate decarboxylase [Acidobacteriota bacterium]